MDLVTGVLTTDELRANTLFPVSHDDATLSLMGISKETLETQLKCAGLPDMTTILGTGQEASDALKTWAFSASLATIAGLADQSLTEINDGHVVTKFSPKNKAQLPDALAKQSRRAMALLKSALGIVTEQKLLGIGAASNTHYPLPLKSCRVENTTPSVG